MIFQNQLVIKLAKCLYCKKERPELTIPDKCDDCRAAKDWVWNGKKWTLKNIVRYNKKGELGD